MGTTVSHYTVSIHYDRRLYQQDIAGSIAHARMLARQGIIPEADAKAIVKGLESIRAEIEEHRFPWREELEDIHMNVEARLFEKIGDVAGRLHTARSRNDQVALDMRLFAKEAITTTLEAVRALRAALVDAAEGNSGVLMPGYTHTQRAQPVLFAHHVLAYFEMLGRDAERLRQAYARADVMSLGSGALAGVPYAIDREYVARELGFSSLSANSMDAVSDRDFMLDFHSAAATCMVHMSRLAEEMVLWSTAEFGFVRLAGEYTTGSSMMPQKRNPDYAELARGRTGRVFGHLMALLTVLKGLPLTYNRDLQEDKEGFFDTFDTLVSTLSAMTGMVASMELDRERLGQAAGDGAMLATDLADYLVARGMPFREAHGVVARISAEAQEQGTGLHELPLQALKRHSELFDADALSISARSSVDARDVPGGTGSSRVEQAVAAARAALEAEVAG